MNKVILIYNIGCCFSEMLNIISHYHNKTLWFVNAMLVSEICLFELYSKITYELCFRVRVSYGITQALEQFSRDNTHRLNVGEQSIYIHHLWKNPSEPI